MTSITRKIVQAVAVCGFTAGPALPAVAASYPERPITVVVAWPAGGMADNVIRVATEKMQPELGQPVVVENRPGAGGQVAASLVAKAAPDGYTLLLTTSALTMNAALEGDQAKFDVLNDFVPIARGGLAPSILMVRKDFPANTVQELLAQAKSNPGKFSYGSAGVGTPAHLSSELMKSLADIDVLHVPYKGAPPVMVDLASGRIDMAFANYTVALPQVQAGRVRPLAVTSLQRSPLMPDTPTLDEAGLSNFEADQWVGLLAPKGTPGPVVERVAKAFSQALRDPKATETLAQNGIAADGDSTPGDFSVYLKDDLNKWVDLVKSAGIKNE